MSIDIQKRRICAFAPGKLMLAGEYSVLFGGKAMVAAIDRYAEAIFTPSQDFYYENQHPIYEAVFGAAREMGIEPLAGAYKIISRDFFCGDRKLGLGSSAASCVALVKVILSQQEQDQPDLILELALKAHQLFSSNLGSGADIAACVCGGVISYTQGLKPTTLDVSWLWPKLIFVDTRRSQNTRTFVAKACAFAQGNQEAITELCTISDQLCAELIKTRDEQKAIQQVAELSELLGRFGDQAEIAIMSPEHEYIRRLASRYGGSAKPSGAGGGDFALALVPLEQHDAYIAKLVENGFTISKFAYSKTN